MAAGREARVQGGQVLLPVDRRTASAAARFGGDAALLYEYVPETAVLCLGQGRVAGVRFPDEAGAVVELENYVTFVTPVPRRAELTLPRARSMLRLEDEVHAAILREAGIPLADDGAQEAQTSLATRVGIKRQVLRNWGNRCAITGQGRGLDIVAIRPRETGGLLHARNYMPMVPLAAAAWEQGVIAVGPSGDVVADLARLDPDLLESMDRSGRLLLPKKPELHPDPADLSFHLHHVFAQERS